MIWVKKNAVNLVLVIVLFIGLGLLLYPSLADYWNSFHQSRAIASYTADVANLDNQVYEEMMRQAKDYNQGLSDSRLRWILSSEEEETYNDILNVSGTGIMSYIEIPSIKCYLPIYHGTNEDVLQIAVGHIAGTSLPIGGDSTHCVISGHRGLPSARLFTDIDKLVEGDVFLIRTLDEVLTYEVDRILIVLPHELEALEIEQGKDLCTLVTCTPYGINTHRLLVRGHRIATVEEHEIRITADAQQIEPTIVAPIFAVPMLLILLVLLLTTTPKKQ